MAWLDKGLKQRMVGAVVLIVLIVIFLPMLLTRKDERRQVEVEVPPRPEMPAMPQAQVRPANVPEPVPVPDPEPVQQLPDPVVVKPVDIRSKTNSPPATAKPSEPARVAPKVEQPKKPEPAPAKPAPAAEQKRLDANNLPVSWSIQLASLSSRSNADALVQKLRAQGYNAYLRVVDGMHRVFVGPVIERAEADRLRGQLSRQQNVNGFVVRFQPERH
ncbi:SPOR domain-containing protein [Azomonas macrocytogenes]|uniref:DedD protein n=1 Tax=Azomonas macrocytogenes TaxID=69962 RepID=A0A839T797_AZOMA|nr:SPOR domain-containing protein [Azomonas macrocytogenes]MBB3103543.1 DedD protein [Azomonas macrocytogenes]